MSPVYIKEHSKTKEKTILGDTPDQSGSFTLFDGTVVEQDFSRIDPENLEQIYVFNTLLIGRVTMYLSPDGKGGRRSLRPKGVYNTYNYSVELHHPIREEGEWRRKKENDCPSGKVLGWETKKEYISRMELKRSTKER